MAIPMNPIARANLERYQDRDDVMPNTFKCSVSGEVMNDPVSLQCDHAFERAVLNGQRRAGNNRCAECRGNIPPGALPTNGALKRAIEEFGETTLARISDLETEKPQLQAQVTAEQMRAEALQGELSEAQLRTKAFEESMERNIAEVTEELAKETIERDKIQRILDGGSARETALNREIGDRNTRILELTRELRTLRDRVFRESSRASQAERDRDDAEQREAYITVSSVEMLRISTQESTRLMQESAEKTERITVLEGEKAALEGEKTILQGDLLQRDQQITVVTAERDEEANKNEELRDLVIPENVVLLNRAKISESKLAIVDAEKEIDEAEKAETNSAVKTMVRGVATMVGYAAVGTLVGPAVGLGFLTTAGLKTCYDSSQDTIKNTARRDRAIDQKRARESSVERRSAELNQRV